MLIQDSLKVAQYSFVKIPCSWKNLVEEVQMYNTTLPRC